MWYHCTIFVTLSFVVSITSGYYNAPVSHSAGVPWPLPQQMHCNNDTNLTVQSIARIVYTGKCKIVQQAIKRWTKTIFPPQGAAIRSYQQVDPDAPAFDQLTIYTPDTCEEWPHFGMDESYSLNIAESSPDHSNLTAASVWGVLRGLATFSQLFLYVGSDPHSHPVQIRPCQIQDWPRFEHRGILVDTSRHYVPVEALLDNLDLMETDKYNVFHWHIVDDQSFPFESVVFPEMSAKGAYSPKHVYTPTDVSTLVAAARDRGIRVVVEFDSPGHTRSWGVGLTDLLTECYNDVGVKTGERALLNPFAQITYDTVLALFTEVLQRFPDKYIHLGGDEVSYQYSCWLNNPSVQKMMKLYGFKKGSDIENFYFKKYLPLIERARPNTGYIVWQEVLDHHIELRDDVIAHVWKGNTQQEIDAELDDVTGRGHRALLSSCWYLNYIHYGSDWKTPYMCEPQAFNGTDEQKRLVVGGEACMWGEFVDGTNLISRLWPRASVVAERLWSDREATSDPKMAEPRIEEHRCRMVRRGFPAEPPNGPNHCPVIWKRSQKM